MYGITSIEEKKRVSDMSIKWSGFLQHIVQSSLTIFSTRSSGGGLNRLRKEGTRNSAPILRPNTNEDSSMIQNY